ncbi:TPA: hypothetical protein IFC13_005368, partial [Escherichia coli]|nr:hypothetical protein [Escherichia coli]
RHNFSGSLDTAEDYYATYSPLWGQYPEALLFVNWLYNHSSVLHERAEIIKCAEMLMQEDVDWPPESPDNQYHLFK